VRLWVGKLGGRTSQDLPGPDVRDYEVASTLFRQPRNARIGSSGVRDTQMDR
jgi:hypothetical protein